jgi:hypothetical protein
VCVRHGHGHVTRQVANTLDYYPRELSWEVLDATSRERLAGWSAAKGGLRPTEDFASGGILSLCRGVFIVVIRSVAVQRSLGTRLPTVKKNDTTPLLRCCRDSKGDGSCCEHGFGATSIVSEGRVLFEGASRRLCAL